MKNMNEGDPKKRNIFHSGPVLASAAVAAAAVAGGVESMQHHETTGQTAHVETIGSRDAGSALYSFFKNLRENHPNQGISSSELHPLQEAALDEFLIEHPGLREFIIARYGAEPSISGEIIITGTMDGEPPSISDMTAFAVSAGKTDDLFIIYTEENGDFFVSNNTKDLEMFFPESR